MSAEDAIKWSRFKYYSLIGATNALCVMGVAYSVGIEMWSVKFYIFSLCAISILAANSNGERAV